MSIILDNKGICQALSKIIGWWEFSLIGERSLKEVRLRLQGNVNPCAIW